MLTTPLIAVFSYYVDNGKLEAKFGKDCVIVGKNEVVTDHPSLEFVAYQNLLDRVENISKNNTKLVLIANDTFLTKNYDGILKDILKRFSFISNLQSPYIVAALNYSMIRLNTGDLKHTSHVCSQFYLLNQASISVLKQALKYAEKQPIPNDIYSYAKAFYPMQKERKAYAIKSELYVSKHLLENSHVLDINKSPIIYVKNLIYKKICFI